MSFPKVARVRQLFEGPRVEDIEGTVRAEIGALDLSSRMKPGATVAVTAGSRGVANIDRIMKSTVDELKSQGASPFIVPAMGSHGGATAEGQLKVLASYGITEATMAAPIRSSMEVVEIGQARGGLPILVDKEAYQADHIVLVNRVKPHTGIDGEIESGLMKILVIGLGKHQGAKMAHRAAVTYSLGDMIVDIGRYSLKKLPILFGLGTVENARDQTAQITAMKSEELEESEKRLLEMAKALIAKIPFDFLHLLIIDEMGKEISGTGIDPNVVGRGKPYRDGRSSGKEFIRIFVRSLTQKSYGNAVGIGMADFTTKGLADNMDRHVTYTNALTSTSVERIRIPMVLDSDQEAIEAALSTVGIVEEEDTQVVRIKNTLHLQEMLVSEALLPQVRENDRLEIVEELEGMAFDKVGNLVGSI